MRKDLQQTTGMSYGSDHVNRKVTLEGEKRGIGLEVTSADLSLVNSPAQKKALTFYGLLSCAMKFYNFNLLL